MKTQKINPLDLAVRLYRTNWQRTVNGLRIAFIVPEDTDFQEISDLAETVNIATEKVDEARRELEIYVPPGFFFKMEDYLQVTKNRTRILPCFFIAEFNEIFTPDSQTSVEQVRQYMSAVSLYRLLTEAADHVVDSSLEQEAIFLGAQKLSITPEYSISDLRHLNGLDDFEKDFINPSIHLEQKRSILKQSLNEMFSAYETVPLAKILARFDDLLKRVKNSYSLYMSEFSFEKIRSQVEKERTEFIFRLNKVLSDIQNQLLAIPVALILAGGQMRRTGSIEFSNLVILFASGFFTFLTFILIANQKNALTAVQNEYTQQKQRIMDQHQDVAAKFETIYRDLEERHDQLQRRLTIIQWLIAISFLATAALFSWYSGGHTV